MIVLCQSCLRHGVGECTYAVQSYPVLTNRSTRSSAWLRVDDKGYLVINISSMTMISGYWNPNNKKWNNVGSVSYLGLSEVNTNGNVRTVKFSSSNANQNWNNQKYPQVFLACEHCNRPVISGWSFFFLLLLYFLMVFTLQKQ